MTRYFFIAAILIFNLNVAHAQETETVPPPALEESLTPPVEEPAFEEINDEDTSQEDNADQSADVADDEYNGPEVNEEIPDEYFVDDQVNGTQEDVVSEDNTETLETPVNAEISQ